MGLLDKLFGRGKGQRNLRHTPEESDLLFLSPDFVRKYMATPESQKDAFLAGLNEGQIRHFLDQGRAMKEKRIKDLGH